MGYCVAIATKLQIQHSVMKKVAYVGNIDMLRAMPDQ
ncbi:hypothetical protein T10_10649 [Trichinella papuae]|uniref:Uncharacterized protein n=1 Tax=Trichinella papuae TaxID=268474 RepID=A0A0V1LYV3_9BILA|nr:hypothetical protein T10_10649 [Trichinella papuae]